LIVTSPWTLVARTQSFVWEIMKRINIAGTSLVTGSALADAVLAYWVSLARLHRLDTAEIPFVDGDGSRQHARLVLSADCPIWTSTVDSDESELEDADALADLRMRAADLEPSWSLSALDFD